MRADTLDFYRTTMTAKEDLKVTVLMGQEGIGPTYAGKLTYGQCSTFLYTESNEISEENKNQRPLDIRRAKLIAKYLLERENTLFPAIIIVVTHLELVELLPESNGVTVMQAVIPASAERLIIDGQHRQGSLPFATEIKPELKSRHLDIKIVVVDTDTICESETFVRQIFCDVNSECKKTNKSQGIHFNSESSLDLFTKEVLVIADKLGASSNKGFSKDGKIKQGQLYNLAGLSKFISIMIGIPSKVDINKFLDDNANYELYLITIAKFIAGIYEQLPFLLEIQSIQGKAQWSAAAKGNVITCAIGLHALAYVGRSLIEDALEREEPLNLTTLSNIMTLPLSDNRDALWLDKQIYNEIAGKITIIKSSEKRLANIFCHKMRLIPCEAII